MAIEPVLIGGKWRESSSSGEFQADNPSTREALAPRFPISTWADCDAALEAAVNAAAVMRTLPAEAIGAFLDRYADEIERRASELVELAHAETALPKKPRLADVELPRTTNQLRQAAAAAREGSWKHATIDTKQNIRSYFAPLGPVCVFGPNNFPFAFNSIAGGDFAAAIAAGNPVIAKANTSHPGVTRLLGEAAVVAMEATDFPRGAVQLLYRLGHADGAKLVSDPRVGATGYTGSREAGLTLKKAADIAGKPIYLELSSINPVVMLPGAIKERGAKLAEEFTGSCLMGAGQFCTNPGLVVLIASPETEAFIADAAQRFGKAPVGTLLSGRVGESLTKAVKILMSAGAQVLAGGQLGGGTGHSFGNTLLRVSGKQFLAEPEKLQSEAFGNVSLLVVADNATEAEAVIRALEGNLTGALYTATTGEDDALYAQLEPPLRRRVGRLLNDKMPTGVAVSPAMNHGGPFPATGHPGFTAVGIPAALVRFGMLQCYDNVRPARLPLDLQDKNPNGCQWRSIDGVWTQGDVGA